MLLKELFLLNFLKRLFRRQDMTLLRTLLSDTEESLKFTDTDMTDIGTL